MKQTEYLHMGRMICSVALLGLLCMCSLLGASQLPPSMANVPVFVALESGGISAAKTIGQTRDALRQSRERELSLLEEAASDAKADNETVSAALEQMRQIALRMEQEAAAEAALSYMGFTEAAVVSGNEMISVFVSSDCIEEEKNRVRLIDCICMHTGVSAENVKIILSKK